MNTKAKKSARRTENKDSTSRLVTQTARSTSAKSQNTVEVLYQKMGERWFAFSVIEDEVFVGSISPQELSSDGDKGRSN